MLRLQPGGKALQPGTGLPSAERVQQWEACMYPGSCQGESADSSDGRPLGHALIASVGYASAEHSFQVCHSRMTANPADLHQAFLSIVQASTMGWSVRAIKCRRCHCLWCWTLH